MKFDENIASKAISLAKKYGATELILFGSALKLGDEARDLDLACDGIEGSRLYEFAGMLELEIETPVDVVPLSPPTRFTTYIRKKGKVLL